jgi:putative hydrolase of HD superfamily
MLNEKLIRRVFVAASIRRWNDQASPIDFCELDKQAHKAFLAYLLAKFEEEKGEKIDFIALIEGFIFEFLQRAVLTDIKPSVFHKLASKKKKELNEFVLAKLEPEIADSRLFGRMKMFLDADEQTKEQKILRAAHFLASNWEFDIIYNFCPNMYGVAEIKQNIQNQIEEHYELSGVQRLMLKSRTTEFVNMVGQLRFQQRWSQTPRIPKTSVLGHTLTVAIFGYLLSLGVGGCQKMRYNAFFGGLFHDLPEVLTRDIISPIKYNVEGLDELIKEYEKELVENEILPLLPKYLQKEVLYFVEDEFGDKITQNGVIAVSQSQIIGEYNNDAYNPMFGTLSKFCDLLAAYAEAKLSIEHGISSTELTGAVENLRTKLFEDKYLFLDGIFDAKNFTGAI